MDRTPVPSLEGTYFMRSPLSGTKVLEVQALGYTSCTDMATSNPPFRGFDLSANEARVYLLLTRFGARKRQRVAKCE